MAVASESNSTVAVLVIGLEQLEASDEQTGDFAPFTYANLPTRLLQDGLTESRAYSLQLTPGSQGTESGSILFGTVDHDKYSGSFQYVPMVNVYANQGFRNPIEFDVTLTSIKTGDTTISNTLYPVLLDSGTTLVYAPGDVVDAFGQALGGTYSDYLGLYTVPCSAGSDASVTFNFQGIDISVPASEFILSTDETGTNDCVVGVLDSGDDHFILGSYVLLALSTTWKTMKSPWVNQRPPTHKTSRSLVLLVSQVPLELHYITDNGLGDETASSMQLLCDILLSCYSQVDTCPVVIQIFIPYILFNIENSFGKPLFNI